MTHSPKHKIALGIVGAVLVVVLGPALWINSVAARKFEGMERHVHELRQEMKERDLSRPPRAGIPVPGNAWEDYDKALAAVTADKAALGAVDLFVQHNSKADPEEARARVAAHAATLDLLRSGARRQKCDPALQWELGSDMQVPGILSCSKLGNLVAARARILAGEGRTREAMDVLLDGWQFGLDLKRNSTLLFALIGHAVGSIPCEELRNLVVSGALAKEDLLELDRCLEAADLAYPRFGQTLLNESLSMGYALLQSKGSPDFGALVGSGGSVLGLWRYGFSGRLTFASAFDETYALMKRASSIDELSWPEARKLLADLEQEGRASKNPIVQAAVPGLLSFGRQVRDERTQMRLLRAVAAWRATGTCPELDDPFGTRLRHSEVDGRLRVWSVGLDGRDHGGIGGWKPEVGKDMLLEGRR